MVLAEARKKDALDRARVRGEEPPVELLAEERGLHSSIEADVRNLLEGKTSIELEALRTQIESQMSSGTAKVVEYWEVVLKRLQIIYKAKACLKEIHAKMLRKHLQHLEPASESDKLELDHELQHSEEDLEHDVKDANTYSAEPVFEEDTYDTDEAGSFSPELLHGDDNEEAIDPEEDRATLVTIVPLGMIKRLAVLEEQQKRIQEAMAVKPPPSEENFELKAMKAMGAMEEGDALFGSGAEVNLDSQVYWWHDKYRPRKPKYFNRVHTGYEWNTIRPITIKTILLLRLCKDINSIFSTQTLLTRQKLQHILLRGTGAMEGLAFRIVNKEWEYSHKKGFKCTFERGILHVYFNFKRYRYRR
ncbi:hypothetical protein Tsubulata_019682 [Turnera subulata]|uniref:Splicing factor Cactin n=1 Tax=Turnera subulata TaxID=218843 RepID=A0A9Q0JBC8_9ROSI|nr:hypothetical protein Tsubulata_019682 [Turnera subulata]